MYIIPIVRTTRLKVIETSNSVNNNSRPLCKFNIIVRGELNGTCAIILE